MSLLYDLALWAGGLGRSRSSGVGVTYLLTVSPTSSDFGSLVWGSSAALSLMLTNIGTGTVDHLPSDAHRNGFQPEWTVITAGVGARAQNGGSTVTFAPAAHGTFNGNVAFASNATNSPANEVPLSEFAIEPWPLQPKDEKW